VALPGGLIATAGRSDRMVASADGNSWPPLPTQPPYRPSGVARDSDSGSTLVWTSGCAALTAKPEDSILRLSDG
jgi:hypothetical protein